MITSVRIEKKIGSENVFLKEKKVINILYEILFS